MGYTLQDQIYWLNTEIKQNLLEEGVVYDFAAKMHGDNKHYMLSLQLYFQP